MTATLQLNTAALSARPWIRIFSARARRFSFGARSAFGLRPLIAHPLQVRQCTFCHDRSAGSLARARLDRRGTRARLGGEIRLRPRPDLLTRLVISYRPASPRRISIFAPMTHYASTRAAAAAAARRCASVKPRRRVQRRYRVPRARRSLAEPPPRTSSTARPSRRASGVMRTIGNPRPTRFHAVRGLCFLFCDTSPARCFPRAKLF